MWSQNAQQTTHKNYVNNEDACKSLITQNMISHYLNQTPKMHMVTQDNNKDGHNNIGVTKKHINTQKAKQDELRA